MSRVAFLLATVGGLGDRLPAPGTTVGSVAGAAFFVLLATVLPVALRTLAPIALLPLLAVAVWACGAEAARRGVTDPGPVVLDEVAGQWAALAAVVWLRGGPVTLLMIVVSFLLFRVLDVLKPWPIRALERLPGGWGIVADDLAAGLAAGVIAAALLHLS
jgi:phosphatidylglycerophosphatase A